ncbi:hypothetical protein [Methylomonas sp. MgM2]
MNRKLLGSLLMLMPLVADAKPQDARSLPLDQISLERINIQGHVQTWRLRKVCIDGQAYLFLLQGITEVPMSIAASFKDGIPEQCRLASSANAGDE